MFYAPLDWNVSETTVYLPDLLVVRRADATGQKLTGTPVLAVEVSSPSTARVDRTLKFDAYAEAGLGQYWIVGPGSGPEAAEGTELREPSVEIYDLADSGSYELQVRVVGGENATMSGPVPVTVTPADLVA